MIRQSVFSLSLLLCDQAGASTTVRDEFLFAIEREVDNRALAREVVTALSKYHDGAAQGPFWAAYAELERRQWPVYREYAECYGLSASGFTVWVKARASTAFARLFPDKFISILADSTRTYTEALEKTPVSDNPRDHRFWDYVVAQEKAQVRAFSDAEEGEFSDAAEALSLFTSTHIPDLELLPDC